MSKLTLTEKKAIEEKMMETTFYLPIEFFPIDDEQIEEEFQKAIKTAKPKPVENLPELQQVLEIKNIKELQNCIFEVEIEFDDGSTTTCEMVWFELLQDINNPNVQLLGVKPIFCTDDKIFEVYSHSFIGEWWKTHVKTWTVTFFHVPDENISENEVICFNGEIYEIEEDDIYVTVNGINYLIDGIVTNEDDEPFHLTIKKENLDEELWEKIESDNFMGIIRQTFIHARGSFFEEEITIERVENDILYCTEYNMPALNSGNIRRSNLEDNDDNPPAFRYICINFEYIPYSVDEEL